MLVEDNKKVYTVIKFIKGKKKYSKKELYFGPVLLKRNTELFQKYNKQELEKLNLVLKLMPKNKMLDRYNIKKKINMYK